MAHKKPHLSAYHRQEIVAAYLFILPTLVSYLIFVAGPLVAGLGLSLFDYNFFNPPKFIGLNNFATMLRDPRVVRVFANNLQYVVGMVLLDLVWSLSLALALNSFLPRRLKAFFRAVLFFPVLTSGVAIAIVWRYLFNRDFGVVNYYLGLFSLPKIPWLAASKWVIPSVGLMSVWNGLGFNMLLFLAGLQSIPREMYEAAALDGASRVASFRYITLPLLTPTIFFVLVKGMIAVFQLFSEPYVLTGGGPGDASRTIALYIYETGFRSQRLGYASALALVLFIIILSVTLFQFSFSRRWVFYR